MKIHYNYKINYFGEISYKPLCGNNYCGIGNTDKTLQTRDKEKVDCVTCLTILKSTNKKSKNG